MLVKDRHDSLRVKSTVQLVTNVQTNELVQVLRVVKEHADRVVQRRAQLEYEVHINYSLHDNRKIEAENKPRVPCERIGQNVAKEDQVYD